MAERWVSRQARCIWSACCFIRCFISRQREAASPATRLAAARLIAVLERLLASFPPYYAHADIVFFLLIITNHKFEMRLVFWSPSELLGVGLGVFLPDICQGGRASRRRLCEARWWCCCTCRSKLPCLCWNAANLLVSMQASRRLATGTVIGVDWSARAEPGHPNPLVKHPSSSWWMKAPPISESAGVLLPFSHNSCSTVDV